MAAHYITILYIFGKICKAKRALCSMLQLNQKLVSKELGTLEAIAIKLWQILSQLSTTADLSVHNLRCLNIIQARKILQISLKRTE